MNEKKVILYISQPFISKAIAFFINSQNGWSVIEELENPLLAAVKCRKFDLLIADATTNITDSQLETLSQISKEKLVFLCNPQVEFDMVKLLAFQARGYLSTDLSPSEFLESLINILKGQVVVSHALLPRVISTVTNKVSTESSITPREKEIIKLLTNGLTNKEIAKSLYISENTVKNHVHNILDKLSLKNRANLVSYAFSSGLVEKSCLMSSIVFCTCLNLHLIPF